MFLLDIPLIGFLVVLMATALLFGELIVRGRGLLGIVGLGLMAIYFSYYLNLQNLSWLGLLFIVGLVLIILDIKLTNHGFIALIGMLFMMTALAIPGPYLLYKVLVVLAFILGTGLSPLFLKIFPARKYWAKMTLKDRLTGSLGYNSMNENYRNLVGKQGVAVTPFRPIGTVSIDDQPYSAITEGKWLPAGVSVVVMSVDGTRIVVKEKKNEKEKS